MMELWYERKNIAYWISNKIRPWIGNCIDNCTIIEVRTLMRNSMPLLGMDIFMCPSLNLDAGLAIPG